MPDKVILSQLQTIKIPMNFTKTLDNLNSLGDKFDFIPTLNKQKSQNYPKKLKLITLKILVYLNFCNKINYPIALAWDWANVEKTI